MRSSSFVKFIVLILSSIAVIVFVCSLGHGALLQVAGHGNYWFACMIFGAFGYFLWRRFDHRSIISWFRNDWAGFFLALLLAGFLQIGEPHVAKVLFDEDDICGTAYQMHTAREATYPVTMHHFDSSLFVQGSTVDKRPVMFPFLLSIVHDLTGYRPANVFVLNGALGFVLFLILYILAKPLIGATGGCAAMALTATMPLLAQNVTGAGFEVLNVCLILAFILAARRYLNVEKTDGLDLFVCVTLMLATTRYESALYVFALVAVVVIKWWKEKHISLTWFSVFSPLLLVSALLSFRVFYNEPTYHPTRIPGEAFFSFSYLHDNALIAAKYLFSGPSGMYTNSLILSVVGCVSIVVVLVRYLPKARTFPDWDGTVVASLAALAIVAVTTFLCLINNWGQWNDPIVARYSLPLQVMLPVIFILALHIVFETRSVPKLLVIGMGVWLLTFTAKQNARHAMTNYMSVSHNSEAMYEWADKNADSRDLFVMESSMGMILHEHPAVPIICANLAPWKIKGVIDAGIYRHVYVCQSLFLNDNGAWEPMRKTPEFILTDAIKLRSVAEMRTMTKLKVVISEVTDVDDPEIKRHPMPADVAKRDQWFYDLLP